MIYIYIYIIYHYINRARRIKSRIHINGVWEALLIPLLSNRDLFKCANKITVFFFSFPIWVRLNFFPQSQTGDRLNRVLKELIVMIRALTTNFTICPSCVSYITLFECVFFLIIIFGFPALSMLSVCCRQDDSMGKGQPQLYWPSTHHIRR